MRANGAHHDRPHPAVSTEGRATAAAGGGGVVDEQAVAEFARELSALGPEPVTGDADEAGATESSLDGDTESMPSAQS